jgi:lysozyme
MANNAKAVGVAVGALLIAGGVATRELIAPNEGLEQVGYIDPTGTATACLGHVKTAKVGAYYSQQQCMALLAQDVTEHAMAIAPCIKVPVPHESMVAFISFGFWSGAKNFCTSTLAKKLNAGDLAGACAELSRWTYSRGKQLPGLVRRRAEERRWCESGLLRS